MSLEVDREEYAHSPWSMLEFVLLLAKFKTSEARADQTDQASDAEALETIEKERLKYFNMVHSALIQKDIPLTDHDGVTDPEGNYVYYLDKTTAHPWHCLKWAKKRLLSIPKDFHNYITTQFPLPKEDKAENHPENIDSPHVLDVRMRKELGTLRREKEKWDLSVEAAVVVGLYCARDDVQKPVTRPSLKDHLHESGIKDLPDTTFDKIWGHIPPKFKHRGGRPKGKKDAH